MNNNGQSHNIPARATVKQLPYKRDSRISEFLCYYRDRVACFLRAPFFLGGLFINICYLSSHLSYPGTGSLKFLSVSPPFSASLCHLSLVLVLLLGQLDPPFIFHLTVFLSEFVDIPIFSFSSLYTYTYTVHSTASFLSSLPSEDRCFC